MKHFSFAILMSSLIGAACYLEMHDKPVGGLWFLIVMLVMFGDWS